MYYTGRGRREAGGLKVEDWVLFPDGLKFMADTTEEEQARTESFLAVMRRLDEAQETEEEQRARREQEIKAARSKRNTEYKANMLRSRIAYLRSRVTMNPDDHVAAGELAMAQSQLNRLLFPMTSD